MALVFNICVMTERAFILLRNFYPNYLPSSWSYYGDFGINFWLYVLFLAVVYFIIVMLVMRLQKTLAAKNI